MKTQPEYVLIDHASLYFR